MSTIGPSRAIHKDLFCRPWTAKLCSLLTRGARVAIVGSRKASEPGLRRTQKPARLLVQRGVVVVSGLAEGIDTEAHVATIESGARTIAVLGTPLGRTFPSQNRALQERIPREHLAVSQFAPGSTWDKRSFPIRNRTMALLSDVTVIVEAYESSGTIHQGWEALRLGRPLFILESQHQAARGSPRRNGTARKSSPRRTATCSSRAARRKPCRMSRSFLLTSLPQLERANNVAKSAASRTQDRPSAEAHYDALLVRLDHEAAVSMTVIDDVITRGAASPSSPPDRRRGASGAGSTTGDHPACNLQNLTSSRSERPFHRPGKGTGRRQGDSGARGDKTDAVSRVWVALRPPSRTEP